MKNLIYEYSNILIIEFFPQFNLNHNLIYLIFFIIRCQCNVGREFKCEVWNMITNNMANYHLYEQKGEMLSSKLVSVNIKLDSFINSRCEFMNHMYTNNFEHSKFLGENIYS